MGRTLTPGEKLHRRAERIRREDERVRAHKDRTEQLRKAVAEMALRRVQSARAAAAAYENPGTMWAGKPARHYDRASTRQHYAMLRLLYALADHADRHW